MIVEDTKRIVEFLEGKTKDHKDRTYQDILDCNDTKMEECHDQIQWMFPIHAESNFAVVDPILRAKTVIEARESKDVKENLSKAKDRMEKFFGIGDYEDRDKQRGWCKDFDHNLLRITRIIRSLRFFELDEEAEDFYNHVKDPADFFGISNVTKAYWWRALNEDIWKTLR